MSSGVPSISTVSAVDPFHPAETRADSRCKVNLDGLEITISSRCVQPRRFEASGIEKFVVLEFISFSLIVISYRNYLEKKNEDLEW